MPARLHTYTHLRSSAMSCARRSVKFAGGILSLLHAPLTCPAHPVASAIRAATPSSPFAQRSAVRAPRRRGGWGMRALARLRSSVCVCVCVCGGGGWG